MVLEHLKKEELATLLLVPTTLADAQAIKARNAALYQRVDSRSSEPVTLPCPHCARYGHDFFCYNCAYQRVRPAVMAHVEDKQDCGGLRCICCCVLFAGATAVRLGFVLTLEHAQANIWVDRCGLSPILAGKLTPFLRAHLEWANVIIQLGGTIHENWRKMPPEAQRAWKAPALAEVIQKLDLQFKEQPDDPALPAKG